MYPPHRRRFHFESIWMTDSACLDIIHSSWVGSVMGSIPMQWAKKVSNCVFGLQSWSCTSFGNLKNQQRFITRELEWMGTIFDTED